MFTFVSYLLTPRARQGSYTRTSLLKVTIWNEQQRSERGRAQTDRKPSLAERPFEA